MSALDIRRIARTLSAVENRTAAAANVVRDAYRCARHVPVVGVTGPPGAGKSTLVDRLAVHWAECGGKIAVLAIDPSSPFSGGALLGDRVRMDGAASHPDVFVRSVASRGELGGLTAAAYDLVMVLDAQGFDRVLIETVGAGQADVAIATLADAVIVVTVPGLGDQVQAAKAGLLEIGDVFVVNKSDLPGAAGVAAHLTANLDLIYAGGPGWNAAPESAAATRAAHCEQRRRHGSPEDERGFWRPPVLSSCAQRGTGVAELARATDEFLSWSRQSGRFADRLEARLRGQILCAARERLLELCLAAGGEPNPELDRLCAAVASGAVSPREAADALIAPVLNADLRSR